MKWTVWKWISQSQASYTKVNLGSQDISVKKCFFSTRKKKCWKSFSFIVASFTIHFVSCYHFNEQHSKRYSVGFFVSFSIKRSFIIIFIIEPFSSPWHYSWLPKQFSLLFLALNLSRLKMSSHIQTQWTFNLLNILRAIGISLDRIYKHSVNG